MHSKAINAFYHIDDYDPTPQMQRDQACCEAMPAAVSKLFLNDDDVVRILFDFAQNNGYLPDDTAVATSPDSPVEFKRVIDALNRKFPTFAGFKDEESALEFVRSRYDQFGQEVDQYVARLASVIDQEVANQSAAASATADTGSASD